MSFVFYFDFSTFVFHLGFSFRLFGRFCDNYLKTNNGKSHIILTTDHKLKINFMGSLICNEKIVKLLAVIVDNKLSFEPHLNLVSKKVRQKLHALTRVSKLILKKKLRVVMKAFIMSQFFTALSYGCTVAEL